MAGPAFRLLENAVMEFLSRIPQIHYNRRMVNTRHSKTLTVSLPDGCEVVLTLIQQPGVGEAAFEEHARRAENALRELQNMPAQIPPSPEPGTPVSPAP